MVRFSPSAVVIATVLAATQPGLAHPAGSTAPEAAQASAPAPKRQEPATLPSPNDAPAQTDSVPGKDVITVGFGWG